MSLINSHQEILFNLTTLTIHLSHQVKQTFSTHNVYFRRQKEIKIAPLHEVTFMYNLVQYSCRMEFRRIGLISPSYGRFWDSLFALIALRHFENDPVFSNILRHHRSILGSKRIWIVNQNNSFLQLLRGFYHEDTFFSSKVLLFVYNFFFKVKFLSRFTISQDDLASLALETQKSGLVPFKSNSRYSSKRLNKTILDLDMFVGYRGQKVLNENIVLLYVRNSFWFENSFARDTSINSQTQHRNSNVEDFEDSVKFLINSGYFVVRIGRDRLTTFDLPGYWNYAADESASVQKDLALWELAQFAISTGGGADQPRLLFGTPVLYINYGEGVAVNSRGVAIDEKTVTLPKIIRSVHSHGIPSLSKIESEFNFKVPEILTPQILTSLDYYSCDNLPRDILGSVIEFEKYLREPSSSSFYNYQGRLISTFWPNLHNSTV